MSLWRQRKCCCCFCYALHLPVDPVFPHSFLCSVVCLCASITIAKVEGVQIVIQLCIRDHNAARFKPAKRTTLQRDTRVCSLSLSTHTGRYVAGSPKTATNMVIICLSSPSFQFTTPDVAAFSRSYLKFVMFFLFFGGLYTNTFLLIVPCLF